MPLIKRDAKAPETVQEDAASHIAGLASAESETRWRAARALAGRADAVPALTAALPAERDPRVREAIMTALMRVGDEASIKALLPLLRSQDAGERGAALEALQGLPQAMLPFIGALFADPDSDVRVLATELARNMPDADATRVLCGLLGGEAHPNVCAAAIEVLAEVGTAEAIPVLQACAARFASSPFVPFAASIAIARLSGTQV
jgi:hypothetical protein